MNGKVGCLPDATTRGDFFCYVVQPLACPLSSPSIVYRGAGYRACEPSIEANATSFNSVLDILANVRFFRSSLSTQALEIMAMRRSRALRHGIRF